MEKVLFRKPDFDKRLGVNRPAQIPKNWYELYEDGKYLKFDHMMSNLLLKSNQNDLKNRIQYWEYDFFQNHVEYKNKEDDEKYFYYIPLHSIDDWFLDMEHIGFSGIEEDVKKDVRNKKCKIILLCTDEGNYGEEPDIYTPGNWSLELIQKWCDLEKFPHSSIIFICMNMNIQTLATKKCLNYHIVPTSWISETHIWVKKDEPSTFLELKENSKLFLTYNFAYHHHRMCLLESLYKNNLLKDSYHSFIFNNDQEDNTKNQYKKWNKNLLPDGFDKILDKIPIEIEDDYKKEDYGNYDFKGQVIIKNHYENSFLSLVSETLYKNNTIYFSEKTFKPISQHHPFILVSSKNSLSKLKQMGYQTFDKWWDESYDECDNHIDRIDMICKILLDLKSKSYDELKKIKLEMRDVLIHNYNNFIQRYNQTPSPIINAVEEEYKKFVKNG